MTARRGIEQPLLGGEEVRKAPAARLEGTPLSAAINLAATAMGTGILTLPFAFARCGPFRCSLLLALLAVTSDVTLALMVGVGRRLKLTSLGAVMTALFGGAGSLTFSAMMATVLFLALTAMQRVVLDLLPMLLEEVLGLARGALQPEVVSLAINVGVFSACLSKSFHALRFTSGAALACLVPFIAAIVCKAAAAALDQDAEAPPPLDPGAGLGGVWTAAPLLASALCCHFSILDIDAELQPRHRRHIFSVIHVVSLGILPATYASVALSGVLLFGADTAENVLTGFHGDTAMQLARGVLSLTNALRMPLMVMPLLRMSLDALRGSGWDGAAAAIEARPWAAILALLAASLTTACRMRVLTRVMGLLGGTGGVLACYCLPGLMHLAAPAGGPRLGGLAASCAAVGAVVVGATVAVATLLTWGR